MWFSVKLLLMRIFTLQATEWWYTCQVCLKRLPRTCRKAKVRFPFKWGRCSEIGIMSNAAFLICFELFCSHKHFRSVNTDLWKSPCFSVFMSRQAESDEQVKHRCNLGNYGTVLTYCLLFTFSTGFPKSSHANNLRGVGAYCVLIIRDSYLPWWEISSCF